MKRIKSIIVALLAVIMITGSIPMSVQAAAPRLSLDKITLLKGATITLKVRCSNLPVSSWSTSNDKVATVDCKGLVTAKNYGKATITARVGGTDLTCKVTVNPVMKANKQKMTVKKGKRAYIKVTYLRPGTLYAQNLNPSCVSIKWKKWKGHVATLRVYGKQKGCATIKFTNTYNKQVRKVKVRVK